MNELFLLVFFCWFYVYEWLKVQFFNYTELCFKGPRNSHLMILLDDESDVLHNADKNFYYHSCIADENLLFMSFFCFVSPVWFDWYLFQVKYGFSTLDWNQLMNMKIKRQAYVWFYLKTFFSCLMIWSTFFLQFRSIDKDADYLWTHLSTCFLSYMMICTTHDGQLQSTLLSVIFDDNPGLTTRAPENERNTILASHWCFNSSLLSLSEDKCACVDYIPMMTTYLVLESFFWEVLWYSKLIRFACQSDWNSFSVVPTEIFFKNVAVLNYECRKRLND